MIIIKTPQPDTEERLVLVPVRRLVPESRDATPDDLGRGGYAPLAAFVGPLDLLTPPTLAGALQAIESIQNDADAAQDRAEKAERALRCQCSEPGDSPCRVHDEERADAAERNLSAALERAERAERERDEARRLHSAAEAQVACRSELRAERSEWATRAYAAERERDTLRAELARLTAPGEGEPTDWLGMWNGCKIGPLEDSLYGRIKQLYRLGVAHERARQPAQERATDEELFALAAKIDRESSFGGLQLIRAIVRAVAARVRQERCLVAQAVEANVDIRVCEDDGGGFMVGVHAPDCDEDLERNVPAADGPATLARLLGEVSRG